MKKMKRRAQTSMLVLVTCLAYTGVQANELKMGMRGSVSMDYRTEVVNFNLKLGDRDIYYKVEGMLQPDKGLYMTRSSFDSIDIYKVEANRGRSSEVEDLETKGDIEIYPRKRLLRNVSVAGVQLKGSFIQGALNDGLFIDDLDVDGVTSQGLLDYNNFLGYYRAKRNLHFGSTPIKSTLPASNILSNHDHYIGQNRLKVTWQFGDLKLEGLAFFSDSTVTSTDSDGNSTTDVVATVCRYDLTITRADGKPVQLSRPNDATTDDDTSLRKLVAMWVLFA